MISEQALLLLKLSLVLSNLLSFLLMGRDKSLAQRHRRRIPERWLLGLAFLGGSIGIWLGMAIFRHKTKHRQFSLGVPMILLCQIAAVFWLCQG